MNPNKEKKLQRILDITKELEIRKALYEELDALILELQREGFQRADFQEFRMELVDNFATGNVAWRAAGIKRFEVKVTDLEKARKRDAKEAAKAEQAEQTKNSKVGK